MSGATSPSPRVALITNIPVPYKMPVFEKLGRKTTLTVIYSATAGTGVMGWRFATPLAYKACVVGGWRLTRSGGDLYPSLRLLRLLQEARPDVIIASGYSLPSLYASIYASWRRIPLILFSEGTEHTERSLRLSQRLGRRLLVQRAAGAVAPSDLAAERFVALGKRPERVFIAPYTTDLRRLWKLSARRRPHASRTIRVLSVGRLVPIKGNARLLDAVALVSGGRSTTVEVEIVGTGPLEPVLREQAARLRFRTHFTGFLSQDELVGAYERSDVFVFPTLGDPFGIVLVEACAAGLPCVASELAGATHDLVTDGESGLIVDPRSTESLAAAIAKLCDDPDGAYRIGQAAYRRTLGRTPQAAAEGYCAAIEAVLGSASA